MSETDYLLDHVMVRVGDLEESMDWYQSHLDYVEYSRWEADTFTNVKLGPEDRDPEDALVELTYNHGRSDYEMGDAWGHIAVRVDDVHDAYEELMDEGVEDYRDPDSCGGEYAFVKDPDGHEVEIVERDHGKEWSLDHTMIRVEDADEALGYWARKFEYVPAGRWESDSFANYFMKPRDAPEDAMTVELTYNYDGRTYEMGDAWGHLAVATDDLGDAWDDLMERESADYRDPESCDWKYAFTKDQDGHEIEVVSRE